MLRCFVCVVWLLALLAPMSSLAEEVVYDRILVKINDDIITLFDLEEEMKPIYSKIDKRKLTAVQKEQLDELRKQTLEKMINDKLMAQEIQKYQIVIPDDVIDDEIKRMKEERDLDDESFQEMVKGDGLTMEEFRNRLKSVIEKQELLGYMVHSKVLVTDTEIQKEYEARHDDYLMEKMVELSIILLPSDISAVEVKKRIEDGELTFAQAAAKYSIGPGSDKGGSIGELNWSDLADEWKQSIEGVSAGGVGSPITVQGKEALLSPVKIVENRLVPLEEVKDDISEKLMQKKRDEVFDGYFEKLKQSSVIIYMD